MTREEILNQLMERSILQKNEYVILAEGFESAFLGVSGFSPARAVYDFWKCLDVIIQRDGVGFDEAIDWLEDFVQEDLGKHSPIYIKLL